MRVQALVSNPACPASRVADRLWARSLGFPIWPAGTVFLLRPGVPAGHSCQTLVLTAVLVRHQVSLVQPSGWCAQSRSSGHLLLDLGFPWGKATCRCQLFIPSLFLHLTSSQFPFPLPLMILSHPLFFPLPFHPPSPFLLPSATLHPLFSSFYPLSFFFFHFFSSPFLIYKMLC